MRLSPPAELMQPCAQLQGLVGSSMGNLLVHDLYMIDAYVACSAKLKALQKWQASN